jgi:hypothetical protein
MIRYTLWIGLLGLLLGCRVVAAADMYVSPDGNDGQDGSMTRPLKSLEAARDRIRVLRAAGELADGGVTVWLRGGDFVRETTLELTSADSGTSDSPVVWRPYQNETVRLLGGRRLTEFGPVTDPAVVERLEENARVAVREVDLRALGISEYGEWASRGFGRPTVAAHCELFIDGVPMMVARWPNEGEWEHIAGFPQEHAQDDGHGGKIGKLEDGFHYAGDRPRRWKDTSELWVHGYWSWDWANSYEHVASLDLDQRLIKTAPPFGQYGFRVGQRVQFLNVLEELDQPGEWVLDRKAGKLYFWPPNELSSDSQVLLSLLGKPFVKMQDVAHVTLQGLTFEATRATAIEIAGGSHVQVLGCQLRNLGNWGVRMEGGSDHVVRSCDIFDTGDGGVVMSGGDRQTLTRGKHVVENCHFARQGRWSKCYVPAVLLSGVGLRVAHNLIHDHPHCAILFGGNEHQIEFNEIHHIALETGDVGAIYTGRDWTYRGNRIRHNFIHHTGGVGMGSMGVYMDDCVSGTEVFGNVFYKVHWAMFIGGGRDHQVVNNIFVDCDPAVRIDGRGLDKSPVWFNMVYDYMKKQMGNVPSLLYRSRYPAIANLDRYYATTDGVPPEDNVVTRNICVGKWLEAGWHSTEGMLKLEGNFVGSDPGFVDPAKMDFNLKADAAPLSQGFQPIPFAAIGLQIDEFRSTVPPRDNSLDDARK